MAAQTLQWGRTWWHILGLRFFVNTSLLFFKNGNAVLQISTEQLQIKSNQYDGYILIRTVTY